MPELSKRRSCTCALCTEVRDWDGIRDRGDVEELRELVRYLQERLAYAEEDLSFHHAIEDGSWPFAREHAERILKRVTEREVQEEAKHDDENVSEDEELKDA